MRTRRAKNHEALPAPGPEAPQQEVSSHVLFEILHQVPQILDQLPQRAAINVAATCWAGLLTLLRHGRRVVRGDVEWTNVSHSTKYGSISHGWTCHDLEIIKEERLMTPVLELTSLNGLLHGLALRISAGTPYAGKLLASGALVDVQDARALYDAAVAAEVEPNVATWATTLARVLEASTDPGMTPLRVRRLYVCPRASPRRPLFGTLCSILETPAVCSIIEVLVLGFGVFMKGQSARRVLDALCANATSLRVLVIVDCDIGSPGDLAVARLIRSSTSLRELHLHGTGSRKQGLATISNAMFKQGKGTVRVLRLSGMSSRSPRSGMMADQFVGGGDVERLVLEHCGIEHPSTFPSTLATHGKQLVDLRMRPLSGMDLDAFVPLVAASSFLRSVDVEFDRGTPCFFRAVADNPALPLERLHLRGAYISDEAAEAIGAMVAASGTLVDLTLGVDGEPWISDAAGEHLARALASNTTLRSLDLSGCAFGPAVFNQVLQAVADSSLEVFRIVSVFRATGGAVQIGQLSRSTTLKTLTLRFISGGHTATVPVEGFDYFVDGMVHNNTLRSLALYGLMCRGGGLARALRTNRALQSLSLARCSLRDDDGVQLARALAVNKDLLKVDLTQNNLLSDETARALRAALQQNKVLQQLCVENCALHTLSWRASVCRGGGKYPSIVLKELPVDRGPDGERCT